MRTKPILYFLNYRGIQVKFYVLLRSMIQLFRPIERYVPKKGIIYDVGCGYGLFSLYLNQTSKDRTIIGIDLNKKRISTLSRMFSDNPNLSFIRLDLTKDVTLGSCDCIILYDLLHHLPYKDQRILLESCKRYLKKDGILIVKEIDASKKIQLFYTWLLDKLMTFGDPLYYSTCSEHKNKLKNLGFLVKQKKIWTIWPYPHIVMIGYK